MKGILLGILMSVMGVSQGVIDACDPPDFNLGVMSCGMSVRAVGNWNEHGYRIFDGPYFGLEVEDGIWIDYPYVEHMIIVIRDNELRYADIIDWGVETIETPFGPIRRFHYLAELYPDIWFAADDKFIYGKKFW